MSGVLFFLGCSASPLSPPQTCKEEEDCIDVVEDDNSIRDKYENVDADTDTTTRVDSPRHIPLTTTTPKMHTPPKESNLSLRLQQLRISSDVVDYNYDKSPIISPIEYLASQVESEVYTTTTASSNMYNTSPQTSSGKLLPVNLDPPSPLILESTSSQSSASSSNDPVSLLSTSTSSLSTTPPQSLSDMTSIINAYQNARLIDDDYVRDKFLDSRPLLQDPEKLFIPCEFVHENVSDLLAECYPELSYDDYLYHLQRLQHNRQELRRLRHQVDQERLVNRFTANSEPTKRSRVKLH